MISTRNKLISLIITLVMVTGFFVPAYAEGEDSAPADSDPVVLSSEAEAEEPEPGQPEECTEHVWGEWTTTKDATYTAAGSRTRTCVNCGETQQETIPVLKCTQHSWSAWTTTKAATYMATGSKTHKCTKCGAAETQTVAKLKAYKKWVTIDGKKYYFNSNGVIVTGWQKIKSSNKKGAAVKWCYFNSKGVFIKGISKNTKKKWVTADGKKFWFTAKKQPIGQGFHMINGKLYYMGADKAMVKGTFKASDGKTYKTTSAGNITGLTYYIYKYKTFVIIDISDQSMKFYKNGVLKRSGNVVTGLKGKMDTPTGIYKIRSKARNIYLTGPTWNVFVKYWMAFIGSAYGLHDASWWTEADFNNTKTYLKYGSHGCVNMRPSDAKYLYNNAPVGTKVIVQK